MKSNNYKILTELTLNNKFNMKNFKFINNVASKDNLNSDNNMQYLLNISSNCLYLIKFNLEYNEFSDNIITAEIENKDNIDLEIICHTVYLNRLYLVLNNSIGYLYDFEFNQLFTIDINKFYFNRIHSSYCINDSKIVITGGINKESNKLSIKVFSFDIALYEFKEEKIKENNFDGRYNHGSIAISNVIYIIGGYNSIKEKTYSNSIKAIRCEYNIMHSWKNIEYKGPSTNEIINPQIIIYNNKNLIAFSSFNKPKVYIVNLETSISRLIYIDQYNNLTNDVLNICFYKTQEFENKQHKPLINNNNYLYAVFSDIYINNSEKKLTLYEANLDEIIN